MDFMDEWIDKDFTDESTSFLKRVVELVSRSLWVNLSAVELELIVVSIVYKESTMHVFDIVLICDQVITLPLFSDSVVSVLKVNLKSTNIVIANFD